MGRTYVHLNLSLVLFAVICKSCVTKQTNFEKVKDKEVTVIKMNDFSEDERPLEGFIELIDVIPLETSSSAFVTRIKRIAQIDNLFFVLDDNLNKLLVFDDKGKFVRQVGRQGHGPGEYLDMADFSLDEERRLILALSVESKSLYEYGLEGEHIRTIKLPFQSNGISVFHDNQIANYLGYLDRGNKNLIITDLDGNILQAGFEFPESMVAMNLLSVSGHITKNVEGGLYSDATSSYIHQIRSDGKIYPKYYIDFGDFFWPEDKRHELQSFFRKIQNGDLNFLTNNYEENDNALVFKYNQKALHGSEKIIQFNNAYFIKSSGDLFTKDSFSKTLFSSILSGPLGLTQENCFISIVKIEDYKSKVVEYPHAGEINNIKLDSALKSSELGDNPILVVYDINK